MLELRSHYEREQEGLRRRCERAEAALQHRAQQSTQRSAKEREEAERRVESMQREHEEALADIEARAEAMATEHARHVAQLRQEMEREAKEVRGAAAAEVARAREDAWRRTRAARPGATLEGVEPSGSSFSGYSTRGGGGDGGGEDGVPSSPGALRERVRHLASRCRALERQLLEQAKAPADRVVRHAGTQTEPAAWRAALAESGAARSQSRSHAGPLSSSARAVEDWSRPAAGAAATPWSSTPAPRAPSRGVGALRTGPGSSGRGARAVRSSALAQSPTATAAAGSRVVEASPAPESGPATGARVRASGLLAGLRNLDRKADASGLSERPPQHRGLNASQRSEAGWAGPAPQPSSRPVHPSRDAAEASGTSCTTGTTGTSSTSVHVAHVAHVGDSSDGGDGAVRDLDDYLASQGRGRR